MNLRLTDEQTAIQEAVRDFATNEIRPAAREAEEAGQVPDRIAKQLFEMGISVPIPEEFGGQGTFDAVTSLIIAEELAWGDPGTAFGALGAGLAATVVDIAGTEEQRAELLPKFVDGIEGSIAIFERDAGADFSLLDSAAIVEGDTARITGTKYAVPVFDTAQIRIWVTREGNRITGWLVPPDAEIVAKPEDKLGLRAAKTYKVTVDGLEIPKLGALDSERIEKAVLRAKLLNAGVALGLGRAALEYATKYAQERMAFGRPIGAFQGISFKIADRAMDIDSARLLAWDAAWGLDAGVEDAARKVMSACGHAVAAAVASADDGVQILGGHGYMKDHPVEMWYRDAMTLATLDSPSLVGDLFLAKEYA